MSGDVQPRKRKDKKRKKDEVSLEEHRGTAAAFGEGDVQMHSQHDHGTGGHWCAKIIFFSLLAVLVTLIGLIILENRGLTELEANSVESQYSGLLDGWIEDAPDDDHHDEHTLDLKHHDDDEHEEEHEEEAEEEIEKIEKEVSDQEEPESAELALPDVSVEKEEETSVEVVSPDEEYEVDEKAFLEVDEIDEPAVERIAPPPPSQPYAEIEEEVSTETPSLATLAEEEEYEKQQEELRQQEAQSTHMWLKLAVGGALLAATHAVIRRATAPRDTPEQDEHASREETPLSDRRMTLIPDESSNINPPQTLRPKVEEEVVQKFSSVVKAAPVQKQESEEVEDEGAEEEEEEEQEVQVSKVDEKNKELYSDDEEIEEDEDVEDEEEVEEKKEVPKSILKTQIAKKEPEPEPEPEEIPDDVEIIEDEQIEEEVEEEVEDEEEISDVDDAELLSRLEAKYGRLPEPERPGQKQKDGGNSLEDEWPGEPSDPYWKEQLDKAEQELRQDWLE